MLISRQAIAHYMGRKLNDYRWMKQLTREQIMRELNQLKVKPVFKREPWLHQLVCFYIGICEPDFMYLLDMGAGKSKILSDLITQAQREKKLKRALITVPRLTNIDSWMDDWQGHSDLEPWPINVSEIEEKWERLLNPQGDVAIVDLQGLTLATCRKEKQGKNKNILVRDDDKIKKLQKLYNFFGIDEIHKLNNSNNLWYSVMCQLVKKADFRYGTTGTLFGHDPHELHSQFYLVDRGETFGPNLGLFRASYFTTKMNPWKGVQYVYNPAMGDALNRMLQHRSLRYEESELQDLPQCVSRLVPLEMCPEQRDHYMRALEGLINASGTIAELDAQWLRMRQIASGYLAWKDEYGDHIIRFKQNPMLDALEQSLDEMGDSKVVVCYDYTETGRMIVERVQSMGIGCVWLYGGTKDKSGDRRKFLTDKKTRVMVMNSEAGGTGNNGLQDVARYMIFYESPTPPITRQQTVKRIHRPGQKHRTFIYDLVLRRSVHVGILDAIKEGKDVHAAVVNGRQKNKEFFLGKSATRRRVDI